MTSIVDKVWKTPKTQRQCETCEPHSYTVDKNLILRVKLTPSGDTTRSWVFRYLDKQKQKVVEKGIGSLKDRDMVSAQAKAAEMRGMIANGNDPVLAIKPAKVAKVNTFKCYAKMLIEDKSEEFRNGKHLAQWPSTLEAYVYPHIGDKVPADVTHEDIRTLLRADNLKDKRETRSRVKQRIANILAYAAEAEQQPYRYNPALSFKLPRKKKSSVKHHAAVPWKQLPAIMASLRLKGATSAAVVRWVVLTAARSGEARGATWGEIEAWAGVWTVPANRMKMDIEHRVPLSTEARAIIADQATKRRQPHNDDDLVFPGPSCGSLSDVAVSKMLHSPDIGGEGFTIHGMRSAFRQWGADNGINREALELALAHAVEGVEGDYQRSDLFDLRVPIMQVWADYLAGE